MNFTLERVSEKITAIKSQTAVPIKNVSTMRTSSDKQPERKPHILRLPTVHYGRYTPGNAKLAVSIPLFQSKKDSPDGSDDLSVYRFQNVHCKGAIWAGLSLLHNSDLKENGVGVYYHIEDSVWDLAMPVFEAFQVPLEKCRKVETNFDVDNGYDPWRACFGKSYLGLLDDEIDPDVMLFWDSDAFLLCEGTPLPFYKTLTSSVFSNHLGLTHAEYMYKSYRNWVGVCCDATSISRDVMDKNNYNKVEQMAFEKAGLTLTEKENAADGNEGNAYRMHAKTYFATIPRQHKVREYLIKNMPTCYTDSALLAMWGQHNGPILSIENALRLPIYDQEKEFLPAKNFNCVGHLRTNHDTPNETKIDEWYDTFWKHLTINMGI